jgi:hypothetical protein
VKPVQTGYVGDLPLPGKMFRAQIHKQPVTFETIKDLGQLFCGERFRFVSSIYLSVAAERRIS